MAVVIAAVAHQAVSGNVGMIKLLAMFAVYAIAAVVDFRTHKIPNKLVAAVLLLRAVLFVPEIVSCPSQWRALVVGSVVPAVAVFILLFLLSVLSRGAIGMGDVKLLAAHTLLCGGSSMIYTFFFALMTCALVAVVLLMTSKKGREDTIPLAPFFYIGYIISLLFTRTSFQ